MLTIHRLSPECGEKFGGIYGRFMQCAKEDYYQEHELLPFHEIMVTIAQKHLDGYLVLDDNLEDPVGFMLFRYEEHRAIEINVIYSETENAKSFLGVLMPRFIADSLIREDWDVVSYAMLGKQAEFIRTILWYKFLPVGQAHLALDFTDAISIQIFQKQFPLSPDDGNTYRVTAWQPDYLEAVSSIVYASFSKAVDANWDPRFRTENGATSVVNTIVSGQFGEFAHDCTGVLLKNELPIGVCFVIHANFTAGNIPLIGLLPEESGKGLGNLLIHETIKTTIQQMIKEENSFLKITATTDTDNIAAIKMYRRMGFTELHNYPHVYLPRERAKLFTPGKWH
ncbi:MAG: GNAT family N-acetyltransferase [Cyanobacteria bacterium P01_H01_bin.74]